jgi:CcmD family protein
MRCRLLVLSLFLLMGATRAAAQPQPPADFVPVENAPPGEQIPAMPLLGAAYGFIWVGVFGYVWSLGRRLQKVEAEISALESRRP